jgi:hypothetical protein
MSADEHRTDRGDADLAEIVSARSEDGDDQCAASVERAAADHDLATPSSDQRKIHEVSRERNNPLGLPSLMRAESLSWRWTRSILSESEIQCGVKFVSLQDLPVNPIGGGFAARL